MAPDSAPPPAGALLDALRGRDYAGLERLMDPAVRMQGVVPGGPFERRGPRDVTACFANWFASAHRFEVRDDTAGAVGDRFHLSYRCRLSPPPDEWSDKWHVIGQELFGDAVDGRIVRLDVLCSGFLPEPEPSGVRHVFDAGTRGCGDGLPQEFRRRIRAIPVGDLLEVVARDPAAKEDLPSLARMMGQRVQSVEAHRDGRLVISVERAK
ncbi:MAG TPA: sulfurtransferase TusA family protein [Acidimicrobiia bacterium]